MLKTSSSKTVVVIGAGPAGLMAAEQAALAGFRVQIFDAMPSAGRKFLLAGKSGMNLTHSERFEQFKQRYRDKLVYLEPCLKQFDADAIRAWTESLGISTFVGSSGRVFPVDMKAAPLLRAWIHRLKGQEVEWFMRHKWCAVDSKIVSFITPTGIHDYSYDAIIFALGGKSWARLGSNGLWTEIFAKHEIQTVEFQASNCGFTVNWSAHFRQRFAGTPLTNVSICFHKGGKDTVSKQGQFVVTERGVEGSLIYAFSADLREQINQDGHVDIYIDLLPGRSAERVLRELDVPRGSRSLSSHLRSKLGLHPVHCALIYECLSDEVIRDNAALARHIKALPIRIMQTFPIDEAISTAGGVSFSQLSGDLMITSKPGWFCAGEMIDWEAPTGGYLLSACFATGVVAGRGAAKWLTESGKSKQEE